MEPIRPRVAGRRRSTGFSLIELMMAAAIAGVLASLAYPVFAASVYKARRIEAMVALLQVQQAQERFRGDGSRYGSLGEIGVAAAVPGGHYVLSIDAPTAAGYVVTAVAGGAQAGDTACRYMRLSVDGASWSTASGPSPAASNDAAADRRCWNR